MLVQLPIAGALAKNTLWLKIFIDANGSLKGVCEHDYFPFSIKVLPIGFSLPPFRQATTE